MHRIRICKLRIYPLHCNLTSMVFSNICAMNYKQKIDLPVKYNIKLSFPLVAQVSIEIVHMIQK